MALTMGTMSAVALGVGMPAAHATGTPKVHWQQGQEISGASNAEYGWSVAVYGTTMVVGAPTDNSGIGAAYVYSETGTTWHQVAELTPIGGTDNEAFGGSVAIYGGTIVVGAPGEDIYHSGYAYIFTGSGSTWTQVTNPPLTDPVNVAADEFGYSVTETASTIFIAAGGDNSNEGAVYTYTKFHGVWTEASKIPDPSLTANDAFGFGISAKGATLVVGAPGNNGAQGAAYVYSEVRGGWVLRATLTASNGEGCSTTCGEAYGFIGGDYFGYSVSISGHTIAVGAPFASVPPALDGVGSGAAYAFTGSGSAWTQSTEFTDANPGQDWYGFDVNVVGPGGSVAVTAPYDPPATAQGAAYVYRKVGAGWAAGVKLVASDGTAGDYFGWNGLTSIGGNRIIVGSPYSPNGGIYTYQY